VRSQNLKPLPREMLIGLSKKIRESNVPILVELHDWALLPQNFHKSIEQHYEVFFSNVEMLVSEPSTAYQKNTDSKNNDQ
ncbi:MAG: hypothetical protein Q8P34_03010, partial [Bacteroidota bacterium]|nr:hypothetical protein [Bacteroidota bacterium]